MPVAAHAEEHGIDGQGDRRLRLGVAVERNKPGGGRRRALAEQVFQKKAPTRIGPSTNAGRQTTSNRCSTKECDSLRE